MLHVQRFGPFLRTGIYRGDSMIQNKKATSYTLVALSFLTLASSAVSPVLASVGEAYPDIPSTMISLLTTIPSLLAIPMTLFCGQIAGKKVSYRVLTVCGLTCNLISGVAPFFTHNFYLLLLWRALFGCGTGILTPLIMPVMMSVFRGAEVHQQASLNAVFTNIGVVMFQMMGGVACARWGWQATFLIYVVVFPALLIVIRFMPEPPALTDEEKNKKIPLSMFRPILKWCNLYFVHMILFYVCVTETSDVVMKSGFGSSMTAAVILSLVTLSGVAGGWLYKFINKWEIRALGGAYLFLSAGYLLMALSSNAVIMGVGAMLVGIGFGVNMPALQVFVGLEIPGYARSNAASFLNVFGSLGSFLSKFIMTAIAGMFGYENGRFNFVVCVNAYLVMALFCFLTGQKKRHSDVVLCK